MEEIIYPGFTLRSYTKVELARLYLPRNTSPVALRKFNRWIRYSPVLWDKLVASGVTISTREYNPKQVQIIIDYLGIPCEATVNK